MYLFCIFLKKDKLLIDILCAGEGRGGQEEEEEEEEEEEG